MLRIPQIDRHNRNAPCGTLSAPVVMSTSNPDIFSAGPHAITPVRIQSLECSASAHATVTAATPCITRTIRKSRLLGDGAFIGANVYTQPPAMVVMLV